MKKIFAFVLGVLICIFDADAVTRGDRAQTRTKSTSGVVADKIARTSNQTKSTTTNTARNAQVARVSNQKKSNTTQQRTLTSRTPTRTTQAAVTRTTKKTPTRQNNVIARAAATQETTETKTGAEYTQCKDALFACMDQFCAMKDENFKRCSCSDRVYKFQDVYATYQQAAEKLTEFAENLDVVGMTYDQAAAMKTASEGEDALTEDKSASKQLLQAIMNAIKGEDASVGGKYKDLNSVTISTDITNSFGLDNSGQIIASYNGTTLYKSVFPTCKSIVSDTCNKASLQRAINAYLMAIEQDCNTVESALVAQQKSLKASTHENSALLDLARVENRKKHNSDDIATCITNIENAITSDEVCGQNYRKCLDYGQFIDVTTGAPLTGVADFYKLGQMLTFKTNENLEKQKLSSIPNNRNFVQFFENKTKKFAQNALDKCAENADTAWKQYLDMALIDIYYAQQTKVDNIEQSCFDLVTACYEDQGAAIASAMANLTGDNSILLKPAAVDLTDQLCADYTESCNNMFNGDIIKTYIANKKSTDSETACRAVAQQCFDKFGGSGYENFYSPQSGLFTIGAALDWFSLYDNAETQNIISPCAQELASTEGCANPELLERVFGGFDKRTINDAVLYTVDDNEDRTIRPRGVASEVYAKIINNLSIQCEDVNGYFLEQKYAVRYDYNPNNYCELNTSPVSSIFYINPIYDLTQQDLYANDLDYWYNFIENENVCPANYGSNVDVQSWGACSCWENGGYRSQNGRSQICRPLLPVTDTGAETLPNCTDDLLSEHFSPAPNHDKWCQQSTMSSLTQVCPRMSVKQVTDSTYMLCANNGTIIRPVLEYVHQRKATESEISKITNKFEVHYATMGNNPADD